MAEAAEVFHDVQMVRHGAAELCGSRVCTCAGAARPWEAGCLSQHPRVCRAWRITIAQ